MKCPLHILFFIIFLYAVLGSSWDIEDEESIELTWDSSGYVFYCPCMGRFGNQAEYLLGALGFAKGLNRTLILPPWRSDRMRNEPFDEYFLVSPVRAYHRVVLASHFMRHFAPEHWPQERRYGFCHGGVVADGGQERQCGMKDGQPFGAFWDAISVDFSDYVFHDIGFDDHYYAEWRERYPADDYPVIALKGAPARFPVLEKFAPNHKYLHWSHEIEDESNHYVKVTFEGRMFIGIHLRNDLDWNRACQHMRDSAAKSYMSSAQCYGYGPRTETIPINVCIPTRTDIIAKLDKVSKQYDIRDVFIATDRDSMLSLFKDLLPDLTFHYLDPYRPQIDLAILSRSDVFIGNCISSFSAFVTRHRQYHDPGRPSLYWGVES